MGRNNYFKFKQFTIHQERAAMKVGTDGVLLGAWVNTHTCKRILDLGTGTGLIALMLAQRCEAEITAIEIEENASLDAQSNVEKSPWADRIEVKNISFQEFSKDSLSGFDLIVSNPPFFENNSKADCQKRNLARHTDSLPFSEFISCSVKLLNTNGVLALILPVEPALEFEKMALENGLYLARKTMVKPRPNKEVNRVLMEFSLQECSAIKDEMTIYGLHGADYSPEHIKLTKAFYLKL